MVTLHEFERSELLFQWHITARCDQNCIHCYMHNYSTYKSELKNELPFEDCVKVIENISNLTRKWKVSARINFTGGDPLLRKDFYDLIKFSREKGIAVGILGNPYHLTYKVAKKLKELGVIRYQLSIDGLEKTHDEFRKRGSFKQTIRALRILNSVGIPSVVMFTLSKKNVNELLAVIELVAKEKVRIFDFARLVPIGSGERFKDELFLPHEYRDVLLRVLEKYKEMKDKGYVTYFGRKEPLWALLYYNLGLLKPLPKNKKFIYSGCAVGIFITILADGTVLPCRRLPIKIGKVPQQRLEDIIIRSKKLNYLRDINKKSKCNKCELNLLCRGCMAVSFGVYSSPMSPDPQCWK